MINGPRQKRPSTPGPLPLGKNEPKRFPKDHNEVEVDDYMMERDQAGQLVGNQLFAMKMGERARILLLDGYAHMVDVHFIGSREHGRGGRVQCLGVPGMVEALGSDGRRCPACEFGFTRQGNRVTWAARRFSVRIAQYMSSGRGRNLEPVNLVPKIWRFGNPTFDKLVDLEEACGGLKGKEIVIECLDPGWEAYDMAVATEPMLKDDQGLSVQYAHLVTLPMDLDGALGVELSFDQMDRMLNPERWLHGSLTDEEMSRLIPLGEVLPEWALGGWDLFGDEDEL